MPRYDAVSVMQPIAIRVVRRDGRLSGPPAVRAVHQYPQNTNILSNNINSENCHAGRKGFCVSGLCKKTAGEGKLYTGPDRLIFCRSRHEAELRFEQVRKGLTDAVGAHIFAFGRGPGQWDTCHVVREFGDTIGL